MWTCSSAVKPLEKDVSVEHARKRNVNRFNMGALLGSKNRDNPSRKQPSRAVDVCVFANYVFDSVPWRFLAPKFPEVSMLLSVRSCAVTFGALITAGLVQVAAEPGPRSRTDFGAMGTAKILCSAVFVSGRDLDEALRHSGLNNYLTRAEWEQLQRRAAPSDQAAIEVDEKAREVHVTLAGYTGRTRFFDDQGCVILSPSGQKVFFEPVKLHATLPDAMTQAWPMGDRLPQEPLSPENRRGQVGVGCRGRVSGRGAHRGFRRRSQGTAHRGALRRRRRHGHAARELVHGQESYRHPRGHPGEGGSFHTSRSCAGAAVARGPRRSALAHPDLRPAPHEQWFAIHAPEPAEVGVRSRGRRSSLHLSRRDRRVPAFDYPSAGISAEHRRPLPEQRPADPRLHY